ncbi:MAG: glycosyltransferase family 2 protein, partial [Caldilineae bacterium]
MSGIVWAFWSAVGVILYTFFGYPLLLAAAARLRPRPHRQAPITPAVTILIPAYNEARVIEAKIENSLAQAYPSEKLDILVVADGSNDDTAARAQKYARQGVRVLYEPARRGKIAAINRAMPWVKSEIVVFTDANAMLTENAVAALVRHFADPKVAAVAGEKRVAGGGEGLYWRYESYLKRLDSQLTSVMGAAGELFALRRDLFQPPALDSIIEDFVLSMELVAAGWRVIYEPAAVALEEEAPSLEADWRR